MKKIIVCFALASIIATPAAFAGKECPSSKKACDKAKTECATKSAKACSEKKACSKSLSKKALLSPKAAEAKSVASN